MMPIVSPEDLDLLWKKWDENGMCGEESIVAIIERRLRNGMTRSDMAAPGCYLRSTFTEPGTVRSKPRPKRPVTPQVSPADEDLHSPGHPWQVDKIGAVFRRRPHGDKLYLAVEVAKRLGMPRVGATYSHKDGDLLNCTIENLVWVYTGGRKISHRKTHNPLRGGR